MIVDISNDLFNSPFGKSLKESLTQLELKCTNFESTVPSVIKWRRTVTTRWDEEDGIFLPIPEEIRNEDHILVRIGAKQFVDFSKSNSALEAHVRSLSTVLPNATKIYLIESTLR